MRAPGTIASGLLQVAEMQRDFEAGWFLKGNVLLDCFGLKCKDHLGRVPPFWGFPPPNHGS